MKLAEMRVAAVIAPISQIDDLDINKSYVIAKTANGSFARVISETALVSSTAMNLTLDG